MALSGDYVDCSAVLDTALGDAREAVSLDPGLVKAHFRRAQLCMAIIAATSQETDQQEGEQIGESAGQQDRQREAVTALYEVRQQ